MNRLQRTALYSASLLTFAASLLACDVAPRDVISSALPTDGANRVEPREPTRAEIARQPIRFAMPPGVALRAAAPAQTLEGETSAPVSTFTLSLDEPSEIVGSTAEAIDSSKTYCADPSEGTSAPDQMFELVIPADCTLSMSLESTTEGFEGAFELQSGCEEKGEQLACVNGKNGRSLLRAMSAGTYYVVVDGVNGTSGDFVLNATCSTPACGDGVRNAATEACDGGPDPVADDGCGDAGAANACAIEAVQAADTCETATPVALSMNTTTLLPDDSMPYTTVGASSDYEGNETLFWPAVDQVFDFAPTETGTLEVTIGLDATGQAFCATDWLSPGCWNHLLYARADDCTSAPIALSYPDFATDDGVNRLFFAVTAGTHYYVFVDGFDLTDYDSGPYYLSVSLVPPQ